MIMKSGIVGKVQYEDIQTIWNVYLPSPKEIEDICQEYMDNVARQHLEDKWVKFRNLPKWKQFLLNEPTHTMREESDLRNIRTFFTSDLFVEYTNFDYFQQMYQSAQTIKLVLKVKRVGAKCSNNLYVEECYLDAIKDVVHHLDYYENILNNYREDFDIE